MHAQSDKDLIGTWAWASVDNTPPDGTKTQPFGPKPGGYLTFDASGRFFWLITRPGRSKFAWEKSSSAPDSCLPMFFRAQRLRPEPIKIRGRYRHTHLL